MRVVINVVTLFILVVFLELLKDSQILLITDQSGIGLYILRGLHADVRILRVHL